MITKEKHKQDRRSQARSALAKANRIRSFQAAARMKIRCASMSVEEALGMQDLGSMTVDRLLQAVPPNRHLPKGDRLSTGKRQRPRAILARSKIHAMRRIDSLSEGEAATLLTTIAEMAPNAWVWSDSKAPKLLPSYQLGDIDPKQRKAALAEGNRIRRRRAEIKKELRRGEVTLAEVLADPDAQTWAIGDLVTHLPSVDCETGEVLYRRERKRCRFALSRTGISSVRKVKALTEREKTGLVAYLEAVSLTQGDERRRRLGETQ